MIILPIAVALKTLEGSSLPFGLCLPTLYGLRLKLGNMNGTLRFVYCGPLLKAVSDGFEERFNSFLNIYDDEKRWIPAYIAMVSNPKFKLNYLGMRIIPSHISEKVRSVLYNAGKEILDLEKKNDSSHHQADVELVSTNDVQNQMPMSSVSGLVFFL